MPMSTSYHVVCDLCNNYAGYNAWPSSLEAITAARRLGWTLTLSASKTNPGTQNVHAICVYCVEECNRG